MTAPAKTAPKAPAKRYEPTPLESKAIDAYRQHRSARPLVPRIKVVEGKNGAKHVMPDHPDLATAFVLLGSATGIEDTDFLLVLIEQLANAGSRGKEVNELMLNAMLSVVKSIEPRDQLEAMLAAQMAATHNAVMTFARRLNNVDTIPQQDSAERAYNKLARTYVAQIEAFKRYRNRGDQTVRVEHVTVNEGGQAIVGNVSAGGKGEQKSSEATP